MYFVLRPSLHRAHALVVLIIRPKFGHSQIFYKDTKKSKKANFQQTNMMCGLLLHVFFFLFLQTPETSLSTLLIILCA